jgi:hypothetical protein
LLAYTSDNGLIGRIYKELKKLNPKINEPAKKWANELNNFFKERSPNGQKTHAKMLTSLAIKEMQVKTTLRFHLTLVRIAIIKNTTNKKCW